LGIGGRKRLVLAFTPFGWQMHAPAAAAQSHPRAESERPHSSKWRITCSNARRQSNGAEIADQLNGIQQDRPHGFVPSAGTSDGI